MTNSSDPRMEAIDVLSKFMCLPEAKRLTLLKNFSFNVNFTNQVIQGFVDCDKKYRDILILSAGLHYQLTHANNQFASAMELHSRSIEALTGFIEALTGFIEDTEAQEILPPDLPNLFSFVVEMMKSLREGFSYSIKLNQMAQDNYFRDVANDEDRIFSNDARDALAYFISERSRIIGTEDDAEVDEDALNAALNEWTKNFKEGK